MKCRSLNREFNYHLNADFNGHASHYCAGAGEIGRLSYSVSILFPSYFLDSPPSGVFRVHCHRFQC